MLQAFFNGLSGMMSFSKNLNTVSNNISNMNTPGFRASDTFYSSLSNGDSGLGTFVAEQNYRFQSGEIRQTGNATDVAISGLGFFTLMKDGQQLFSRAGQFSFNDKGVLVDLVSGASVAAIGDTGKVTEFDISKLKVMAPKATTKVEMSGNLSTGATSHEINNVSVYNGLGEKVDLTFKFSKKTGTDNTWEVSVLNESKNNQEILKSEIQFGVDGTPKTANSSFTVSIPDSLGGTSSTTIHFGDSGSFSGSTSTDTGTTSTLEASVTDGASASALQSVKFESDGSVTLTYSSGETKKGPRLALAKFANENALELQSGSLFSANADAGLRIGRAGENGMGKISGKSIELSNVDLSREFADMIVIQRGYQASSRILNVSNQLLEQLYENTRGR